MNGEPSQALQTIGDVFYGLPPRIPDRFYFEPNTGCWLWTGYCDDSGYGRVWWDGAMPRVHRVTYSQIIGPIPTGLTLDHLCRMRSCGNPFHLEPVTIAENIRRGTQGQWQRRKTHCPAGHPYEGANIYPMVKLNGRGCVECRRRQAREYQRRKRSA